MFGYIRPYKSEMLVREYDQYKAVYCELCRQLGRHYGRLARLTLSYDCTFYTMLALAVNGSELTLKNGHCMVNPLRKCKFIACRGEEYKKAAALSVIMTYHKIRDTLEDDKISKSVGSRLLLPFISLKYKKAAGDYPLLAETAEAAMAAQREAEADPQASIDKCSEPTAHMMALLCEELAGQNCSQALALKQFGYFFGRWIYLMDAADDLQRDLKDGAFNPFIHKFSLHVYRKDKAGRKNQLTPMPEQQRRDVETACNEILNATMSMMIPPLNLVEMENFGTIIENIIKKGLPEMQREILFLRVKEKTK